MKCSFTILGQLYNCPIYAKRLFIKIIAHKAQQTAQSNAASRSPIARIPHQTKQSTWQKGESFTTQILSFSFTSKIQTSTRLRSQGLLSASHSILRKLSNAQGHYTANLCHQQRVAQAQRKTLTGETFCWHCYRHTGYCTSNGKDAQRLYCFTTKHSQRNRSQGAKQ